MLPNDEWKCGTEELLESRRAAKIGASNLEPAASSAKSAVLLLEGQSWPQFWGPKACLRK